jgi:hypothetical protein
MTTVLVIGLPVLIILSIVMSLKLKIWLSFLLIVVLGVVSPFIVDFFYCSILNNECKPDALEAVGFFFLAIYVIVICSVIYGLILNKVKQKGMHGS